jgi:hypothetical protein
LSFTLELYTPPGLHWTPVALTQVLEWMDNSTVITLPTTLVLGAGASEPYGYSLGPNLVQHIRRGREGMKPFLEQLGCNRDVIDDFCQSLARSALNSIDAYLARVERHRDVGRLALAYQLLHEDSHAKDLESDWLGYVWQLLVEGVTRPEEFAGNRLNIVTFNYDTSVERFLVNAFKHTFDVTLDDAVRFTSAIQIVHVYGTLPFARVGTSRLGPVGISHTNVREAAERIIVLHEGVDDSPELKRARDMLTQAQFRVFLGFSYIPENVRRLRPKEWLKDGPAARGTTYGLTTGEIERVQSMFRPTRDLVINPGKCLNAMRDWVHYFAGAPL